MPEPLHDVELALIREDSPLSIREQRLLATIDAERRRAESAARAWGAINRRLADAQARASRVDARVVLKHLKRAGHDRLGECHKIYPAPGTWNIEMDVMPCYYGEWLPDDNPGAKEIYIDSERETRTECQVCTCGYSAIVWALEQELDTEKP